MGVQEIFYGIAIFFGIVTVAYFVGTYLEDIPSSIKAVLAFLLSAIIFFVGDYLRRLNK